MGSHWVWVDWCGWRPLSPTPSRGEHLSRTLSAYMYRSLRHSQPLATEDVFWPSPIGITLLLASIEGRISQSFENQQRDIWTQSEREIELYGILCSWLLKKLFGLYFFKALFCILKENVFAFEHLGRPNSICICSLNKY